jgi:predicted PurR-regulated permease PerM
LHEQKIASTAAVCEAGTHKQANQTAAAVYLFTLIVLAGSCLILYPFLPAITGAAFMSVITRRAYHWWSTQIRNPTAAASSAVLLVTISIVGPLLFVGQYLVGQAIVGIQLLQDGLGQHSIDAMLHRFPRIAAAIESSSEFITVGEALQKLAGFVVSQLVDMLGNSLAAIGQIAIMLFLLFFVYRDQEVVMRFISSLLPLTDSETALLMRRLGDTLRATVVGRLVVATSQGAVATVVFAALGVRSAVVLGLITTVFALVPPLGPYLVWLPVAIWFGATGDWVRMAILLGAGALIISALDNFLYPALVGAHLRQHTAAVFLSILGGIWAFGIAGVVLGPLIFSAAEALLAIWRARLNEVSDLSRI